MMCDLITHVWVFEYRFLLSVTFMGDPVPDKHFLAKLLNIQHIFGKNYLSWVLDTDIHLDSMGLGEIITEENDT